VAERAVQHHYGIGRHLYGHARHALFAGVAGDHRDSIEAVAGAAGFDGFVAIGGCDKTYPAARWRWRGSTVRRCSVYGGTIRRARSGGTSSQYSKRSGARRGKALGRGLLDIERTAIPARQLRGMYTANTMASAIEALGLSLPGSSAQEPWARRSVDCRRAGEAVVRLVREA